MTFKALLASKVNDRTSTAVVDFAEDHLMPGDVVVAINYSTVNYKDALAVTGRAPANRQCPLIPGIDFAGILRNVPLAGIDSVNAPRQIRLQAWGRLAANFLTSTSWAAPPVLSHWTRSPTS